MFQHVGVHLIWIQTKLVASLKIFKNLPNVFDIADDILVVRYDVDGKDHDDTP